MAGGILISGGEVVDQTGRRRSDVRIADGHITEVGPALAAADGDSVIDAPGYLTDMFGDEAVRTIEAAGDQPFFISLHFNAPHWPWEGREDAAVAAANPNSMHYDGGNLAKYKEMVEAMDQNVAKVLAALARMGVTVRSAHVDTLGPQAVDVFYLQEADAGALSERRAADAAHAVRAALTPA